MNIGILITLSILSASVATQAPTPVFDVEGSKLDLRLDAETRPSGWTLTEGQNPDILIVPVPSRDGQVEACLASGERAYCQTIAVGDRHDFIVRSGGKDYPTRFEGVFRPPMAVFDAAYQGRNLDRIRTEVPEVYELVNVAIALTDYAEETPRLIYSDSPYYG